MPETPVSKAAGVGWDYWRVDWCRLTAVCGRRSGERRGGGGRAGECAGPPPLFRTVVGCQDHALGGDRCLAALNQEYVLRLSLLGGQECV